MAPPASASPWLYERPPLDLGLPNSPHRSQVIRREGLYLGLVIWMIGGSVLLAGLIAFATGIREVFAAL